jgi:Cof subfamily protein (haloacid dehalogenase superfamily)
MIRLLVSDIDGTLVTKDKRLTEAVRAAALRLKAAGVALALTSSRPPQGLAFFADALGLQTPRAGFNGGTIVGADGGVLEALCLPELAARQAVAHLTTAGIDPWLFTTDEWLLTNPNGDYVAWEQHTVKMPYRVVASFAPYLSLAGKIMAGSKDVAKIASCEAALQVILEGRASVHRSQDYYLDITHKDANKGYAVRRIASLLGVDVNETAVIGDMPNDVPMFDVAAYRIAMGNAPEWMKARADYVTASNEADGWAQAVNTYVLPAAKGD